MALKPRPVFLDTSVFVGGVLQLGSEDEPAHRVMDALAKGRLGVPKTAWHCCLEFYSVVTRLPVDLRVGPEDAARLLEEEIVARCEVLDLPRAGRSALARTAAQDRVAGGRIYDLHIAEVARLAGASAVVTENRRHFSSLLRHHVRVLTTAEYAEEIGA